MITSYNLLIGVLVIAFHSCNISDNNAEIDYKGFVNKEIKLVGYNKEIDLKDSLGLISLEIPARLDTFYKWHRTSDCLGCGRMQYRFADKRYSQFAEGGFYWTVVPDSVFQLTISHTPIRETPDSVVLKPLIEENKSVSYYHRINSVSYIDSVKYLFKEFRIINARPFIISAFVTDEGYLTKSRTLFVVAATSLKTRDLFFIGECGAKDTSGFVDNMYESFLSIKIKENP
jgi:hypothetical protein